MATYFVSGFMRSGTSMMMRALEAGGLDAVHNPVRNRLVEHHSDKFYSPNSGGLYELTSTQYQEWGFPQRYKGKLVKCLYGGILRLAAVDDFKVVFMRRDAEEIRQSYEAFFGTALPFGAAGVDDRLGLSLRTLRQRRDIDVVELQYRDVVSDPLAWMNLLRQRGWPIDAEKAAAVVDPQQCRFRLETLTVGA